MDVYDPLFVPRPMMEPDLVRDRLRMANVLRAG